MPAGNISFDILRRGQKDFYIRSISGKGLNLLNVPLPLADGEQVIGVQIVLGADVATVAGRVVAAGEGSVAAAGVVLLPTDQRKWHMRSSWNLARADAEGNFSLRLAPGDYIALAWSPANEPTVSLESYVSSNLGSAQRFTIQPNETKAVEVRALTPREP